jgi:hypothetical protein
MSLVGVDCVFTKEGTIRVSRVQLGEEWRPVSQGRQWQDQSGRHMLIMLVGGEVRQLTFHSDRMTWDLSEGGEDVIIV